MDNTQQNKDEKKFTIPLILGEETRPKIERFDGKESSVKIEASIFYQQYRTALSSIAELVNYNKYAEKDNLRQHNNIFIFNGDRGSGKTSCMLNVCELLCNNKYVEEHYKSLSIRDELVDVLTKTSFQKMDVIDPIMFDDKHNILDLFIGMLFSTIQDKMKQGCNSNFTHEKKMDLLNLFAETKRLLSILGKDAKLSDFDDLEQLNDLAASIRFKNCMKRLVTKYIDCMHGEDHQLILCIDDIDLNMSEGYVMVEQIRKYLNIPGLIILMAVKMDQLANVIRIKYSKDFDILNNDRKYDETINGIVERYITKLFPQSQRIQLPSVTYLLNQNVGIFRYGKNDKLERIEVLEPLKNGILKLIYAKLRMLEYNTSKQINYIIPQNLRELLNMIHLLYNLEDAKNHKEAVVNLVHFKNHFYGGWCTNNLDKEGLEFMRSTLNVITPNIINQKVIRFLKKRFDILVNLGGNTEVKEHNVKELINILDDENIMYNISLGDVLACLDWLDKVCNEEKDRNLVFAIKVFYSMYLYEGFRTSKDLHDEKFEKEIINREMLTDNETDYGDILNGNFFNSEYINAAPYENGEVSRCRRVINSKIISYNVGQNHSETERRIYDFFILTTAFVFDSKEKPTEDKNNSVFSSYRKKEEVYYEKKVGTNRNYVCFDVLSIFYNLLDIEKTYKRYNIDVKELDENEKQQIRDSISYIANKNNTIKSYWEKYDTLDGIKEKEIKTKCKIIMSPLYKEILGNKDSEGYEKNKRYPSEIAEEIEKDEEIKELFDDLYFWKEDNLLYRLNIRNVEILEQISYRLQRKRPNGNSDNIELLKEMFKTLSEFEIQTHKGENIDFKFFGAVQKFLEDLNQNDNLKGIFDNIYIEKEQTNPDINEE